MTTTVSVSEFRESLAEYLWQIETGKSKKIQIGKIYVQLAGLSLENAKEILKVSCTRSHIPEALRLAHMIASGIISGESGEKHKYY